jgi:6-phospho-beta-glucosidase
MKGLQLPKLVILGGSSPFTVELINQFARKSFKQAYHLVLCGRNDVQLDLVGNYARHHLIKEGWFVENHTDLDNALDGADMIIHQNRYGGQQGRLEDERFAEEFGFTADETLGPCGLKSAIRMAPGLMALAGKVVALCPDAILINLTNPLSIAVSILQCRGVKKVLGICELPVATFEKVAETIGLPAAQINWDYAGLNHRGFIYNLSFEGKNLFPAFLEKISITGFNGFTRAEIEELGAVPLKYFHLFSRSRRAEGRALQVKSIGDSIIGELSLKNYVSPESLKDRNMDWYEKGVIPLLNALNSPNPQPLVINQANESGLTVENKALVSRKIIEITRSGQTPVKVLKWTKIFMEHEKAVLKAALTPDPRHIREALEPDPLLREASRWAIQQYLIDNHQKEKEYANT